MDFEIIVPDQETGELKVAKEAIAIMRDVEKAKKAAVKTETEMKAALMAAMEKYGIEKIKTDELTASYVGEHETIRLDQKELKEKFRATYDKCLHVTTTKASVRITLKDK